MIVCIAGASCTGKTNLALELVANDSRFEIISVDSVMVYSGLDIGSAKPSKAILENFPHHLVDVKKFYEKFSVGDFVEITTNLIADIKSRKKIPLLVGGTMMYFNALINGIHELPVVPIEITDKLQLQEKELGLSALHEKLLSIDPTTKIHQNDRQRIIRSLAFFEATGLTLTRFQANAEPQKTKEEVIFFNLTADSRNELSRNIEARAKSVIRQGLLDEVGFLLQESKRLGLEEIPASLQTITYKEAVDFLQNGNTNLEEEIKKSIKRLVKMQFTWLSSKFPQKIDLNFKDRDNLIKIEKYLAKM